MGETLKAPFPFFGGKRKVAPWVWNAFGDVPNYVEPFFGSGAVYLARPRPHRIATINDADALIVNFWRALQKEPEGIAKWAAWPVAESEIHARHIWIINHLGQFCEGRSEFAARIEADPDFYDTRMAGYWVYGISAWIGTGWCAGDGSWVVENGLLVKKDRREEGIMTPGIHRKRCHLEGNKGIGRSILHIRNRGQGIHRKRFSSSGLSSTFNQEKIQALITYFHTLAEKLAPARITCGDWSRIMGPSPTYMAGSPCGVFLDPPYSPELRHERIYTEDTERISEAVREWCLANGGNSKLRIVLAGYAGEGHEVLEKEGWSVMAWKAGSSYARANSPNQTNRKHERLWFSPYCLHQGRLL